MQKPAFRTPNPAFSISPLLRAGFGKLNSAFRNPNSAFSISPLLRAGLGNGLQVEQAHSGNAGIFAEEFQEHKVECAFIRFSFH